MTQISWIKLPEKLVVKKIILGALTLIIFINGNWFKTFFAGIHRKTTIWENLKK